jgi:hypothetical protein
MSETEADKDEHIRNLEAAEEVLVDRITELQEAATRRIRFEKRRDREIRLLQEDLKALRERAIAAEARVAQLEGVLAEGHLGGA